MRQVLGFVLRVTIVAIGATVVVSQPSSCPCSFANPEDVVSFLVPVEVSAEAAFCELVESPASGCVCVEVEGNAGFCELQPSTSWIGIGEQGSLCEEQSITIPVCPDSAPAPAVTTTCGIPADDASSEWTVGCFADNGEFDGGSFIEEVEIVVETEERCSHTGAGFPGDAYTLVCTSEFELLLSDGGDTVRRVAVDSVAVDSVEPLFTPEFGGELPPLEYNSIVPSNPEAPDVKTPVSWSEYRKNPPVTVKLTATGLEKVRSMKASGGEVGVQIVGSSKVEVLNERIDTFSQSAQPGVNTKVTFKSVNPTPTPGPTEAPSPTPQPTEPPKPSIPPPPTATPTLEPEPTNEPVVTPTEKPVPTGTPVTASCLYETESRYYEGACFLRASRFPAKAVITGASVQLALIEYVAVNIVTEGGANEEFNAAYYTKTFATERVFGDWPDSDVISQSVFTDSGGTAHFDAVVKHPEVTLYADSAGIQQVQNDLKDPVVLYEGAGLVYYFGGASQPTVTSVSGIPFKTQDYTIVSISATVTIYYEEGPVTAK